MWQNIRKTFHLLPSGQLRCVWNEVRVRIYRALWGPVVLGYAFLPREPPAALWHPDVRDNAPGSVHLTRLHRPPKAPRSTIARAESLSCDITKPFQIKLDGQFHLITAWEVMEHVATPDLTQVFTNICDRMESGGFFIASTTETSDVHQGLELHRTRWTNAQWAGVSLENFS